MSKSTKPRATADDVELGKRLKLIREAKGLTQKNLSAKMGISYQQIQKYENGQNRIYAGRLNEIMQHLEVSWDYFFENNSEQLDFLGILHSPYAQKDIRQLWNIIPQHDIRLCLFMLTLSICNKYNIERETGDC